MADNVQLNAMGGGAVVATDDVAGVQYQRVKIGYGTDGAFADVNRSSPLPATVVSGTAVDSDRSVVATPGTAVQLGDHPQTCGVTVRADPSNTGPVYVGGPTVSAATGFPLVPGEAISLDVDNANAVYVDAANAGDGVSLIWVSR